MSMLDLLRKKDGRGRFVRLSGEELAAAIQAGGGVGSVTGCIQTLRRNIIMAKRDLSELVQRELIEYRRKGREGAYYLVVEPGVPLELRLISRLGP